ncbi:MAG: PilN domain-containing protein [Betaproteobacteria bacterium]|nr:PilN domain-containing protein [Betaproteobacteria bacterium]
MIRINLLPHREQKRQARAREFNTLLAASVVVGLLIVLLGYTIIGARIENQKDRNEYLKGQIALLDHKIADIKHLKAKIMALLERKQVVEKLEVDRSQTVHLLDQLVTQLPPGVALTSIHENGDTVSLNGYAQSNARVSDLMRRLSASPWLASPHLIETQAATVNSLQVSEFSLTVKLRAPQTGEANARTPQGKGA